MGNLITIQQASKALRVSVQTVRRWIHLLGIEVERGPVEVILISPEQMEQLSEHSQLTKVEKSMKYQKFTRTAQPV